ncbi:MAG: transposase, IS4 family [Magnetococcales bacterium]|nr:transposase, IS4 family [Magnetococcales bacterium]
MGEGTAVWIPVIQNLSVDLFRKAGVTVTPLATGHAAIDMDVYSMDNSGTKKAGVLRTDMDYDGYAPIVVSLGETNGRRIDRVSGFRCSACSRNLS